MNEQLSYLLDRFLQKQITESELHELSAVLLENEENALFFDVVEMHIRKALEEENVDAAGWESIYNDIVHKKKERTTLPFPRLPLLRRWGWVAASALFILSIGGYFWFQQPPRPSLTASNNHLSTEILPGKDGAVLTLDDGRQIVLDSLDDGVIASGNGSQAALQNGLLIYTSTGKTTNETAYNNMSTPKGTQFHLQLPDGTRVWLNAASSLRYPTVFSGEKRVVTVTGEAYFEVAKNAKQPFLVKINDQAEIEVLGTSFNINAYENETNITTTLLEGSVRVRTGPAGQKMPTEKRIILKPGQQARISLSASAGLSGREPGSLPLKVISNIVVDKVMAWKNGLFNFEDVDLEAAMKQLERWYNIEVVYEKSIPNIRFGGEMSRDVTLNGLLKLLSGSQLHFRIEEGRRLVILP